MATDLALCEIVLINQILCLLLLPAALHSYNNNYYLLWGRSHLIFVVKIPFGGVTLVILI